MKRRIGKCEECSGMGRKGKDSLRKRQQFPDMIQIELLRISIEGFNQ